MRTVDPVLWSRKVAKPAIDVARPWRYRVGASRFERRMRLSLRDAMRELLRNCSVEGVRSVFDERNPRVIRSSIENAIALVWSWMVFATSTMPTWSKDLPRPFTNPFNSSRWCYLVLLVSSIAAGLLVACCSAAAFGSRPPLTVVLQSAPEPVREVVFPAVALCSYNTISAGELDKYARHLYNRSANRAYSLASLKRNLLAFSGLMTSSSQVRFDANFTHYLREVVGETNVTRIIYELSPKCESMLDRCSWHGELVSCARLFAMRMTDVGYCCVFNARYSSEDQNNPPYKAQMIGQDYGLSVIVRENTDDFTNVRRSGEELEMLIFDGREYPLRRAGVFRTLPARRNASVLVTLQASVQRGWDYLGYYTDAWRGCTLSSADGDAGESWSACVAECRRRAALAICLCAPHTEPRAGPGSSAAVPCSLDHLACLDKHKEKLTFFYPGEAVHASLSEEQADSVACLHCRASCARVRYAARAHALPYGHLSPKILLSHFGKDVSPWNSTLLRIYFTSLDQPLHLVEPYMRFYELIVLISSQWVLVVGATMVTALEVVYHCTVRWRHHYTRRRRMDHLTPYKTSEKSRRK